MLRAALRDAGSDFRFDLDVEVIATLKDLSDGVDGYDLEHAVHGALIYEPNYFQHGPVNAETIVDWWRNVRADLRDLIANRPATPVQ